MIQDAWDRVDQMIMGLDIHMGYIVDCCTVEELTDNAAFEAYEENLQLRQTSSPLNVLANERGTLLRLLERDKFEDLPTAVPPENAGSGSGTSADATGNGGSTATGNGGTAGTSGAAAAGTSGGTNYRGKSVGAGGDEDDDSVLEVDDTAEGAATNNRLSWRVLSVIWSVGDVGIECC